MINSIRINELINHINKRKTEERFGATYRDNNDLKELAKIISSFNDNKEELDLAFDIYNFLGEQYESMGRFSVASDYRLKALEISKKIYEKYNDKKDNLNNLLYVILRDRNYYIDDDCFDVKEVVLNIIEKDIVNKTFENLFVHRRNLKHDPIEMSLEYLNIIDEIEEKIDKNINYRGFGSCHEIWNLKFQYLLEKGINWNSPAILNPHVIFD